MADKRPDLHFYFLSDPSIRDDGGALRVEAEVVRDYEIIKDMADLVRKVMLAVASTGGKIRSMIISGHGGGGGFQAGANTVYQNNAPYFALGCLAPFFAPDAEVIIRACNTGQHRELLQGLSSLLGGVKVSAYDGTIYTYKWWIFKGMAVDGNRVSCVRDRCNAKDARGALDFEDSGAAPGILYVGSFFAM